MGLTEEERYLADKIKRMIESGEYETVDIGLSHHESSTDSLEDFDEEFLSKPFVDHIIEPMNAVICSTENYDGDFAFIEAFKPTDLMAAARKGAGQALFICEDILDVQLQQDTLHILDTIFSEYDEYAQELELVWETMNEIISEGLFEGVFRNLQSNEFKRLKGLDKLLDLSSGGFVGAIFGGLFSQYKRTKWELEVFDYYSKHVIELPEELGVDLVERFQPYLARDLELLD